MGHFGDEGKIVVLLDSII